MLQRKKNPRNLNVTAKACAGKEAAVAKEVIIIVKKNTSLHPNNRKGDPRAKPKPPNLPACRREHKGDPKRPVSIPSYQLKVAVLST